MQARGPLTSLADTTPRMDTLAHQASLEWTAKSVGTSSRHGADSQFRESPSARKISGLNADRSPEPENSSAQRISSAASDDPEHRTSEKAFTSRPTNSTSEAKITANTSQRLSNIQPRREIDADRRPSRSMRGSSLLRHTSLASDRRASGVSSRSDKSDGSMWSHLGRLADSNMSRPRLGANISVAYDPITNAEDLFSIGTCSGDEDADHGRAAQARHRSRSRRGTYQLYQRAPEATFRSVKLPAGSKVRVRRKSSDDLEIQITPQDFYVTSRKPSRSSARDRVEDQPHERDQLLEEKRRLEAIRRRVRIRDLEYYRT
jgi:hypothetical protein